MRQIFILISCVAMYIMTEAQSPKVNIDTSTRVICLRGSLRDRPVNIITALGYAAPVPAIIVNGKTQNRPVAAAHSSGTSNRTGIQMRCMATTFPEKPLLVVDGVIKDEFDLSRIDPNNIKSIEILKDAAAQTLYGIRGTAGVVIITTKTANQKTIYVKDILTGEPLPGASIDLISFTNKKDTIHLIADSLGRAVSKKLSYREEYELSVSSTGYKPFKCFLMREQINNKHTVLLARDYKSLEVVTVKANQCMSNRRISGFCSTPPALCGQFRCLAAGITINMLPDKGKDEVQRPGFKVYPNPVQRSQKMNIEFTSEKEEMLSIGLISLDGKQIVSDEYKAHKGTNRLEYSVDPKLASGIYGVQLVDQTNKLIRSVKLIIQ